MQDLNVSINMEEYIVKIQTKDTALALFKFLWAL